MGDLPSSISAANVIAKGPQLNPSGCLWTRKNVGLTFPGSATFLYNEWTDLMDDRFNEDLKLSQICTRPLEQKLN